MTFLKELEVQRRETPGVQFVITIDQRFRQKVHELLVKFRSTYMSYASAMYEVFHNHRYLWSEVRMECQSAGGSLSKRAAEQPPSDDDDERPQGANTEKNRAKRQKKQRKQEQRQQDQPQSKPPKLPPAPEAGTSGQVPIPRVPAAEWQALSKEGKPKVNKTCRFFNTSAGCRRGDGCAFQRVCWTCGSPKHSWAERHYRG